MSTTTIITSRNAPIDIYMEAPLVGLSREEVHSKRPIAYKTNDQESHRDAWSLVRYRCVCSHQLMFADGCLAVGADSYLVGLLKILNTNSLNSGVTFEGAPESNGGCGSYSMAS